MRETRRRARRLADRWPWVMSAGALGALLLLAAPLAAQAPPQVTGPGGEVPKPPAGEGVIRGRAVVPGSTLVLADLSVALYALRPDGAPGLVGTVTDAEGRFAFEGISPATDIVYLVGTEYGGVPFAQRAVFEVGSPELFVELELRESVETGTALEVPEVTYKFDWVGGQLFVQISHRIVNPLGEVVYVAEDRRAGRDPVFSAGLPASIAEYIDGQGGARTDLVRDGDSLAFWGPVYPGPQDLRYGYLLDGTGGETGTDRIEIIDTLPEGAGRLRVLVPGSEAAPQGSSLGADAEQVAIDDREYASYAGARIAPGGAVRLSLSVPASSPDADRLELARADFWIDHDDTEIRVTAEIHVTVSGTTRLLAPPGQSLLDLELPTGAEFLELTGSTRMLGVDANSRGGLAVRGPLAPGASAIGYRYRIPVAGRAQLDLRFERSVDLLNVLVADNGVVIESERLHRKRPFKQGTRFYLHREAYQIGKGETVAIVLDPLERGANTTARARWAALALAALAALFLVTPLREARGSSAPTPSSELALEREILYESIHDLDHDFETGKINEGDFRAMRDELRASAIALMRAETHPEAEAAQAPVCPTCGVVVDGRWRFCSECGGDLAPGQEPA